MMSKGSRIDTFDRLLDVKQDSDEWKQECIYCKSKKLSMHPIGVVYQPHTIEVYDDLPAEIRDYYKYLPNIYEAVMSKVDADKGQDILVECMDCKTTIRGFHNERPSFSGLALKVKVNKVKFKKYLQQLYGFGEQMRL